MGEYIGGIKIGVMDDLRYVRREECAGLHQDTPSEEGAGALRNPASLWRFPWPDEDGATPGEIDARDMFRTYTRSLEGNPLTGIDHGDGSRGGRGVCLHIQAKGGGYGFNVTLPCPALFGSRLPSLVTSAIPAAFPIQIYGVRYDQRGDRTIFRCGWCEQPFCLDDTDADRLRKAIRKDGASREGDQRKWYEETALRIRAARPWPVAV